jgi:hypothetical protein
VVKPCSGSCSNLTHQTQSLLLEATGRLGVCVLSGGNQETQTDCKNKIATLSEYLPPRSGSVGGVKVNLVVLQQPGQDHCWWGGIYESRVHWIDGPGRGKEKVRDAWEDNIQLQVLWIYVAFSATCGHVRNGTVINKLSHNPAGCQG